MIINICVQDKMHQPNLDHLVGNWSGDDEDYGDDDDFELTTIASSNMLVSKYYQKQETEVQKANKDPSNKQSNSKAGSVEKQKGKMAAGKGKDSKAKIGPARSRFDKPVTRLQQRMAQNEKRMQGNPKAMAKPINQTSKSSNSQAAITALYRTKTKVSEENVAS